MILQKITGTLGVLLHLHPCASRRFRSGFGLGSKIRLSGRRGIERRAEIHFRCPAIVTFIRALHPPMHP